MVEYANKGCGVKHFLFRQIIDIAKVNLRTIKQSMLYESCPRNVHHWLAWVHGGELPFGRMRNTES
jgi:hypothetical protein